MYQVQREYNNFIFLLQENRLVRHCEILKLRNKLRTLFIRLNLNVTLPNEVYGFLDIRQHIIDWDFCRFDWIHFQKYQISSYSNKDNKVHTLYERIEMLFLC